MIKIIADTTSTISASEASDMGIYFLPQFIIFGDKSYRDDNEITTVEFLSKLKNSITLPKTAAPSPALYTPIYQEIIDNGDSALVLTPSSKISGTYHNATLAARDFPNAEIHVVDTQLIGPGLGTVVRLSLKWIKEGVCLKEIIQRIEDFSKRFVIYAYIDSLEYLYKGGRIGSAKALAGSILKIKPILTFKNGEVSHYESHWTKKRAFARIIDLVQNECPPTPESYLTILEPNLIGTSSNMMEIFSSTLINKKIETCDLPPAIIVHVGPGVFAASFFTA